MISGEHFVESRDAESRVSHWSSSFKAPISTSVMVFRVQDNQSSVGGISR